MRLGLNFLFGKVRRIDWITGVALPLPCAPQTPLRPGVGWGSRSSPGARGWPGGWWRVWMEEWRSVWSGISGFPNEQNKTCDAVSGAAPYPRVIRNGDVSARRGWSDAFWSRRGVTSEKTVCRFCLPKGYSAAHSYNPPPRASRLGVACAWGARW